jgi:hypothetical protein
MGDVVQWEVVEVCRREDGQQGCILFSFVLIAKLFAISTIPTVVLSVVSVKVRRTCREMATRKASPAILLLCHLASGVVISSRIGVAMSPAPRIVAISVALLFLVFVIIVIVVFIVIVVCITEGPVER